MHIYREHQSHSQLNAQSWPFLEVIPVQLIGAVYPWCIRDYINISYFV